MNVINKFKLYKYKVKLDKYKLVKDTSIVLVPVVLISVAIPLITKNKKTEEKYVSGYISNYNEKDNYTNNDYYIPKEENTTINNNMTSENITNTSNLSLDLDDYLKSIINSNVSLSSTELNNYINNVNNIEIEYKYADIYNMKNEFLKYQSIDKYISKTSSLFKNGTISAQTIFDIVKKNNSNANLIPANKVNDADLFEVCNIMADLLNDIIKENKNVDENLLSEKIKDLKIVNIDDYVNGFFDPEECNMGFSFEVLKRNGNEFYKQVVEHEIYHFVQGNSINETKNTNLKYRFGFTHKYDNVDINRFEWNWFFEGCAECLACNRNNTKESTAYESIIKEFEAIKVCTILNSNNGVTTFENLGLSTNINDLFDYFGCKTEKEKIEILNMMYSINIKYNLASSSNDFYDKYKNVYGQTISSANLKKELNDDIAQTQTKLFYKNLANTLINKTVKVEEIFAMVSVFENEISRSIWYNSNVSTLTEFYKTYNLIQTELFQLLATSLDVKVEEVQEAYNAYNNKVIVNVDGVTLLNNDQKEFYNYILSTRTIDKMNSIHYVFEKNKSMER